MTPEKMRMVAHIIKNFVPDVMDNSEKARKMLEENVLFSKWMSPSDLALAVLVLEQHILQWRECMLHELETGATKPTANETSLTHEGGLAGEAAKLRFEALSVCFYRTFNGNKPIMAQLHAAITASVKEGTPIPSDKCSNKLNMREMQELVVHRVFAYYTDC